MESKRFTHYTQSAKSLTIRTPMVRRSSRLIEFGDGMASLQDYKNAGVIQWWVSQTPETQKVLIDHIKMTQKLCKCKGKGVVNKREGG